MSNSMLHIAMYPWFAMGHITWYLHLSNKLAERGHRISFLLPPNAESKLTQFNHHPHLITFIPITFPHVDGLPPAAQPPTMSQKLSFHSLQSQWTEPKQKLKENYLITLQARWVNWLSKFKKGSVVYVSFGSECTLKKDEFQQLLLGLESSGCPFLVALRAPEGVDKIEEALPEGFEERVKERGVVYDGWMQQQLLLMHPSIGCFVTHCGSSSITEAWMSECQLVFLPHRVDQFINARLMGGDLKVGVEVERRDEDGWYTKESVCKAVKLVMDEGSEVMKEVRANHSKWREFLLSEGLESSYTDGFIKSLQELVG